MKKGCLFLLTIIVSVNAYAFEKFHELGWVQPGSPLEVMLSNKQELTNIYEGQGYQLIWFNPEVAQLFEDQLSILHYSEISPYFSFRYQKLKEYRQNHQLFEYDLLATDTLVSYVSYSKSAEKEGNKWYFNGSVELPLSGFVKNDLTFLRNVVSSKALKNYLSMHAPANFAFYRQAMIRLEEHSSQQGKQDYIQRGIKKKGDKLEDKTTLVTKLSAVGLPVASIDTGNQLFDSKLSLVIKTFQKQHGLKSDGVIGSDTMYWLNLPYEERLRILALNSERTRLVPKERESLIVVNVPNFRMSYWYDGEPVFHSKVIVGKRSRKTPLLDIKLDSMIVNPTWNVPKKLVYKDILPKVKRDNTYLQTHNFKVLKNGYFGEEVDPSTINWDKVSVHQHFPYQLRQDAGALNALGRYKFNTPNNRAIYLHDTPTKYLFDRDSRAFSSGCIRVQYADQFANVLLKTQGIDDKQDALNQAEQKLLIPMKKPIPVKIVYQTAWYQSGYINYRKDIYSYDTGVKELAKKD
ncbi:murein L,D-transpeptidase [Vibrio sp. HN007]|uniref:L,D-transpeptidase family protein n=1 Tax=Vibrio iocasae TaxID=3098914 RepID=UPI0035D4C64F